MMKALCVAVLLLGVVLTVPAISLAESGEIPSPDKKSTKTLEVVIPRIEASINVDGFLDEPEWSLAALLTGFSQFLPVDGRLSEDSTQVLVWYAPTGINFGIRAYETHGEVRATLADRDKISADDHIMLVLDTFDDQRQAIAIAVNALGVQADGILKDASMRVSNFGRGGSGPFRVDLNPDYVYESKGRLTGYGYEVEISIPFKSLRYQSESVQDWGFNVVRNVQHSGYSHAWTQILQANASFLSQGGKLTGLTNLRRGLVLDFSPEVTKSVSGSPDSDGWNYSASNPDIEDFGANVRWGVTNNLSLNATVNPDFSQVEADVAQIDYDPRRALFFPEKRPFFLDGIELFQTPNSLIYTRRLSNPIGAVKLTGKVSNTNIGFLSGVDRKATSPTGDHRFYNALRVTRDILEQSTIGLAYTDKVDGNHTNRVAAIDGRLVLAQKYTVSFQGGGSFTSDNDGNGTDFGPIWGLTVSRSGRKYGFNATVSGIHGDFNAESGFIRRRNVARANFSPRITWFPKEGSRFESVTGSLAFDGTWEYDRFTKGDQPDDQKFHVNGVVTLRGGWSLGASVLIESFRIPVGLYDNYYIERTNNGMPVDTVKFVGTDRLFNLDYVLNLSTPRFGNFNGSIFAIYGQDDNFWEWAPADIFIVTWAMNWTPTDKLRFNFLYNHQQYIRKDDRSNVQIRRVPRLKAEYQLSRFIFVRLVAQYDSNEIDTLRDNSRTEDPILLKDDEGNFHRAEGIKLNNLRIDWLFSYRPTPGTVFFLGYGSSLREADAFRFRNLDRLSDGFFMKLSYLFRV